MAIKLPPVSSSVVADLSPVEASFKEAIDDARSFAVNFESELTGLKIPAIDATGAIGQLKEQLIAPARDALAQARGHAASIRAEATIPFADESDIPFRKDSTINRQEMKANLTFDDKDVRKNVNDAIRVAREELRQKNLTFEVAGFDPNTEARRRFAATANQVGEAGASGAEKAASKTGDWLNKAVQARVILEAVRGGVDLVNAGIQAWGAYQDEVNGKFDKAAAGYLNFANTVKSVPIIGDIAYQGANVVNHLLGRGTGEEAQAALRDAAANDAHSKEMVKAHNDATDQAKLQTQRAQAEAQGGDVGQLKLAAIARDEVVKKIQEEIKAKLISSEVGQAAIAAENAKYDKAWNDRNAKEVKEFYDRQEQIRKQAADAQAAAQKPFDDVQKQIATTGLTPEDRQLFDFKADKSHTADQVKGYTDIINKLKEVKANQNLSDEVKAWRESLKGPAEQYDEVIAKLKELKKAGLTDDEFAKGAAKAKEELDRKLKADMPAGQTQLASAVTAGSADQVRMQFNASRESQQVDLAQKQLDQAEMQSKYLETIADNAAPRKVSNL